MKRHTLQIHIVLLAVPLFFLLAGCNLPDSQPEAESSPDALYTIVAQTVIAQYTADAAAKQTNSKPVTATPTHHTPTPTQTLSPTAGLTLSPSPTLTRTKISAAILEDDFSDTTAWYAASEDKFGFEYTEGGYRIYNEILNAAIWSVRELTYSDIRIEVEATRKSGPEDGYYGVVCRFHDEGFNYYALVIGDNGFFGILKMAGGKIEFLETGIDENEVIQRGEGATNRISGICAGQKLTLSVNGEQLLEVLDDSFATGDIGMVVGNRLTADGTNVVFDNFALLLP